MVSMVDLEDPKVVYQGQIFWDMVRPGVRLAVLGPQGCLTSIIKKVVETSEDQWYIVTRNSRYLLSAGKAISLEEIQKLPTVVGV
ncbi:MAG: hypothetical protein HY903_18210 [Deltaproteobacteria bacterium]|nr:hypothetical protein [Deltaproteobacteria bacterium]